MPEQPDVRTATSGTAAGDPAAAGQEAVAAGYQIVLPPGWQRIPARRGTDAKIRQILDRAAGSLPP
ncbi:MAG: hypothetical protein J2P30_19545, partial [Actinobacteria bacterium]|nr:hypothetical protein [Actinomycetota bacterium]